MKKKENKFLLEQYNNMKKHIISKYDINEDFVDKVFNDIVNNYSDVIKDAFSLDNMFDNPILIHKIFLSICLNFEFDKDRLKNIDFDNSYINNFIGRIISQTIYSRLVEPSFYTSKTLNHPILLSILSMSSLLKERSFYDFKVLKTKIHKDFSPVFRLIKEAMESLEGMLLLISNGSFSQAMTVYRLYLEQVITGIALIKNPNLIDKYIMHQMLTIRYAKDTSDKDVLKIIDEKNIPARDVKSYLNYGWIEGIEGFSELNKNRYSIKIMAKLCNLEDIYEIYSNSTNYVHMNFLFADINWIKEINELIKTTFTTLVGITINYMKFTGFNFVYINIDLKQEIMTIFNEFINVLSDKGLESDILRLKSA